MTRVLAYRGEVVGVKANGQRITYWGRMMSYCTKCGVILAEGVNFCSSCGTRVRTGSIKCSNCGAIITEGAAFCSGCGAKAVSPREVALEKNKTDSKDKEELDRVKGEIDDMTRNEQGARVFLVIGLIVMSVGVYFYVQTAQSWGITYHPNRNIANPLIGVGALMMIVAGILGMSFSLKKGELTKKKQYLEK